MLQFTVRLTTMISNYMTCVERLTEYSQQTPEAPHFISETKPPANWPPHGRIEFRSACMRYRPELDLVLRGMSFIAEPGQAIGICGRTGAGNCYLIVFCCVFHSSHSFLSLVFACLYFR